VTEHRQPVGASQREVEERPIGRQAVKARHTRPVALEFLEQTRHPFLKIVGVEIAALADGRLTTSVKPIPKRGSSASCSARRVLVPSSRRTRSLNFDAENAGQNRLVKRAK